MDHYYILQIRFDPENEELIEGRLFLTRSTGNQLVQEGLIEAYFDSAADRDAAVALFENAIAIDRPRVDWLARYQQSLASLFIGNNFEIAPDAALLKSARPHRLVIPQEQAFGTGSHESTSLCIELLEEIDLRGKRVLDVGSGSGILALAMLRLGARKAIAFDNDVDAFGPLRENPRRNHLEIAAFIGTLDALRVREFDVVTMNILPDVIIPLLPKMKGTIVVSGILVTQRDEIARRANVVKERTKGEWWAAILST